MPISNGNWTNWTINATGGINSWIGSVPKNLPWFFAFVLVLFYIAMFVLFSQQQGRKKFIAIAFVGMVASFVMEGVSLIGSPVVDASIGFFIIVTVIVFAFGG